MPLEYALQHKDLFPKADQWKQPPAVSLPLKKPLGLNSIPRRVLEKAKRKSYAFNILVAGETGTGKTTFLNTLFNTSLSENILPEFPQKTKTVVVESRNYVLVEDGVTLELTVIDTPGFGDRLDRAAEVDPIDAYLIEQFEKFYQGEQDKHVRRGIQDSRVHACLYFIPPTGKRLKDLDVRVMKALSSKVNLIPVVARADSQTPEELEKFKKLLLEAIARHEIAIYSPSDMEENQELQQLCQFVPFSVVGSDMLVDSADGSGRKVRARSYKWGVVEVENDQHCNFLHLREFMMAHCLHDLIDSTHKKIYAAYRGSKLRSFGRPESILLCDESYETRVERTKQSMAEEMLRKEEDMRRDFVLRVRETEKLLKEREEALNKKRVELNAEIDHLKREIEHEHDGVAVLEQQRMGGKFGFGKR